VSDRFSRSVVLAVAALFILVGHAQQPEPEWVIVPGERVGPVTAETSDAMLAAIFGVEEVQRTDVHLGEGFTAPGTAVYPNDPVRRIEVVWSDDARTVAKEVRLTGGSSVWRTVDGISLGTTLRDIERLNGYPFQLAGFGFDYAGTIVDCGRGRLTTLGCSGEDDSDRIPLSRVLVLRLSPDVSAMGTAEYCEVIGERFFSSGHPAMQTLDPKVYQMIIYLSR